MPACFDVSNGVNQGGILSPVLFCLYRLRTFSCRPPEGVVLHGCLLEGFFNSWVPRLMQMMLCCLHLHPMQSASCYSILWSIWRGIWRVNASKSACLGVYAPRFLIFWCGLYFFFMCTSICMFQWRRHTRCVGYVRSGRKIHNFFIYLIS